MIQVSVIVCTYNQQHTIARTLGAILRQQSPVPFEVIIGDDHSTDGTLAVCREYAVRYPDKVRIIAREENLGVVGNYYGCVGVARGEYIMECGGDDEWCPGRISACLEVMQSHPDVVQMFTDVYYREEKTGAVTPHCSDLFPYGWLSAEQVREGMFHQNSDQMVAYAITRRAPMLALMQEYPDFFSGRKYLAEDKQLTLLLTLKGNFYNLHRCTYYYSIDTPSITHTDARRLYHFDSNMLLLTSDLAEVLHYPSARLSEIYSHILYIMLTRAFLSGDSHLLADVRRLLSQYSVIPSGKGRLLLHIMSYKWLWTVSRKCYEAVREVW